MIIECINCPKKFEVNSDLIPHDGRTIQCSSCNHIWFYKKTSQETSIRQQNEIIGKSSFLNQKNTLKKKSTKYQKTRKKPSNINEAFNFESDKGSEIVKYESKSTFTFGKFISYVLVLIISFIGLIIILDTFKSQLYVYFPKLELLLFSLFETLKDIGLFIKDLI